MTCAIYCRLSKEDEERVQESESIQNQKNILIGYAVENGWDIYKIYCDEDYSGVDRGRPEWGAMLEAARTGKFQIVLCKTQSRFTRDLEMVEKYLHGLFPLWGIRFVAVLDNVDTDVKGNKKARQINGLINEWYLEDLSENIRAVLDQKRRAGKYIGSFPAYGYRKDPKDHNHLIKDEDSADIVRQIFSLYLNGLGTQRIAGYLNENNIPNPSKYKRSKGLHYMNGNASTRHQDCWSSTTVARILKNEVYIGNMIQGTKRKASYKTKKLLDVPKEKWVRVENTHEAIIDRETFDAVQRRIGQRARSDGSGKVHLLARKVRCMDCGSVMHRLTHTYKGFPKSYLQCRLYAATRKNPECSGHTIRLDALTETIEERIRTYTSEYYAISGVRRFRMEPDCHEGVKRVKREIASLTHQEARLREAVKNLYLDKVDGLITQEQFVDMNSAMLRDQQAAANRIASLEARMEEADQSQTDDTALEGRIAEMLKLKTIDRALVDLLIDSIEVGEKDRETGRQQVKINWKI